MKRKILTFILAGLWISLSEFVRNELLFKTYWIEKHESLGIQFPSSTLNNIAWGVWSFLVAALIVYLSAKLKKPENIIVSWLFAFVLMWFVIGNMNVLPFKLLIFAIPLILIEVVVAVLICQKFSKIKATVISNVFKNTQHIVLNH